MQNDFYKQLARLEATAAAQRDELPENIQAAYETACEERDEEAAAFFARKLRDKLLASSDKEMTIDRLGLDTSTATKFIASLGAIIKGGWAKYRQDLRDLPEQEGFPFHIQFPTPPGSEETGGHDA